MSLKGLLSGALRVGMFLLAANALLAIFVGGTPWIGAGLGILPAIYYSQQILDGYRNASTEKSQAG